MKSNRLSRFAIPYVIWMALFVVAPIIMVVIYAFSASVGGFTLDNFAKMGTYTVVFTRSFKLALIATAICVLIGYPVSYKMSKEGPGSSGWPWCSLCCPCGRTSCCGPIPGWQFWKTTVF